MKEQYDVAIATEQEFTTDLKAQMTAFGLPCTDEQAHDFYYYYVQLIETNKSLNLTAITDMHEVVVKHIVDSLSCYDAQYIADGATILDVGTGAGFPGIPLAIYNRTLKITLFDSLQKRLKFLQTIIDELKLENVVTLHGRAEDMSHTDAHRESYDIVTSRAVARLPILLEWTLPYVKQNGYFISLKGAAYEEEIQESPKALDILGGTVKEVRPISLPTIDDKRAVLYIQKTKATPNEYPRKPKDIKEKPL